MKVLSLWQPWASLVALGLKTIETRSWSTKYRGPLAIHAGLAAAPMSDAIWSHAHRHGLPLARPYRAGRHDAGIGPARGGLPCGAIVATCTLVDVVPMVGTTPVPHQPHVYVRSDGVPFLWRTVNEPGDITDQRPYGDFTPGRYAWLLADVVPVDPPAPFKGGQGLTKSWEPAAA